MRFLLHCDLQRQKDLLLTELRTCHYKNFKAKKRFQKILNKMSFSTR
jgi:hypothetical protein